MVERELGGFVIHCDECSNYIQVDSDEHFWNDVIAAMKEEHWKSVKVYGEFEHICPDCQEKKNR